MASGGFLDVFVSWESLKQSEWRASWLVYSSGWDWCPFLGILGITSQYLYLLEIMSQYLGDVKHWDINPNACTPLFLGAMLMVVFTNQLMKFSSIVSKTHGPARARGFPFNGKMDSRDET